METTMVSGTLHLAPGIRVRHPGEPDWGIGQIQSVVGDRVTVNFEHAGKLLIIASKIAVVTACGLVQGLVRHALCGCAGQRNGEAEQQQAGRQPAAQGGARRHRRR